MYKTRLDNKAMKFLMRLPYNIRQRIIRKLSDAEANPLHFYERLSNRDDYKIRIGNYRAIADIDIKEEIICVTFLGHRKNVYEK